MVRSARLGLDVLSGRAALILLGCGMLFAGFLAPGRDATVATALIVVGAGVFTVGVLLPRLEEFELGPGGLKTKMGEFARPHPFFDVPADRLNEFAFLTLGDRNQARELVEEALARSHQRARSLPASERTLFTLRSLIELLDIAPERGWLRGRRIAASALSSEDENLRQVIDALRSLPFAQRVALLLKAQLELGVEDIASVTRRPADDVERDYDTARKALGPYIQTAETASE